MIELTVVGSNAPALVDDCYADLARYKWRLDKDGYVCRKASGFIYLHHIVLPGHRYPEFVRDHRNREKLDNRASNLRWLPLSVSSQNRNAARRNVTGVRGVRFDERSGRYHARVQHKGKAVADRWFESIDDAARFLAILRPSILLMSA